MNVIEVNALYKSFVLHILGGKEITALSDIHFTVAEGEIVGLTGKSGSGKSSLMKCLYRTYLATSGEIRYAARGGWIDLVRASDHTMIGLRRSEIRYCAQFLSVIPRVSALDVVAEPLYGVLRDRSAARERAMALLERLGLPQGLWDAYPVTFSGGEQQRINVARAVIAQPRLLLIDEPTASLDARTKDTVVDLIRELKHEGASVLCISHDEYTLEKLVDRRLHLHAGHLAGPSVHVL
ncbi:phosphonate C-P lyase system protein PhnL [Dinghuibacter silviterrae]|uniref:Alpha-D-ribose 1-methylphosphonate 5-triphosphate synthase subunit PhnL n=1 Tax=Dinghuibacter silviterrae TaxID=1539049 RepID=A0A4R8DTU4_9BACT|nr:phosphonate C-P lyase system protein PhnL [Dinghuibacter silviterrae]TDX00837.1 alpha-D-ribose 1-methylphosphonate 5-triphosphate synthase subunit PhnL [Dinghuibacter silviterrae]